VNGEFVGKIAAATCGANGVNVTDNVGDSDVGRGKFFDVAEVTRHPGDGSVGAFGGEAVFAGAADRMKRIVVDFAAGDDGDFRIKKIDQTAKDAAFCLTAEAEQNEIVAREKCVDDCG